jgi:aminomethyltransferase
VTDSADAPLKTSPLHDLHVELGAKMVPFAGYAMPVHYPAGILTEHLHCRSGAALFDVSHMGQVALNGMLAAKSLENVVPADVQNLAPNRVRYTMFTNEQGGILDDLMVTNAGGHLYMVVNAACKEADLKLLREKLGPDTQVQELADRALLALQGPKAAEVLGRHAPECLEMPFMSFGTVVIGGIVCFATRSGYTGEDGFEISVPANQAEGIARLLLAEPEVAPAGLGARDSLRLEAGLCLFGSDIDQNTTPIEAGLAWTIQRRRREGGGFPGAAIIAKQLEEGVARVRVGIRPDGKAPARAHTEITDTQGTPIGEVTSGGYGPSVGGPVAMGYVKSGFSQAGTPVKLVVRGKPLDAQIVPLPFVPHRYRR